MSTFTRPLHLEFIDGKFWKLLAPFIYYVGKKHSDEFLLVRAGFTTDFASIPRFAWSIIGHPAGKHGKAAVVHDWLYRYPDDGLTIPVAPTPACVQLPTRTRRRCDQIFLEAMKVLGIGWWKRSTMYCAVRVGGRGAWKKWRKAE